MTALREAIGWVTRLLQRLWPEPPRDPYARVRVPVKRGPPSRGAAVAAPEPEDE